MASNSTRWTPLVEREYDGQPNVDGIDFVLTPQERDQAALAAVHLEQRRRELNRRDTAQSVSDALVRGEK